MRKDNIGVLSPIELKILQLLKLEGSMPEQTIAEKLKLNSSTVNYKIRKLEKNGVIVGYKYKFDYEKLGLKTMAWIFISWNSSESRPEPFFEELSKHPEVHEMRVVTGSKDIVLKIYTKDLISATKFLMNLEEKYRTLIKQSSILFVTKRYKCHQVPLHFYPKETKRLNKTDLKILIYLKNNPNSSIKEIASNLSLHRNTVSNKIQTFLKNGIVLKKSTLVNQNYISDIGMGFASIMSIGVKTGEIENLALQLSNLKEVYELCSINAKYDLLAIIRTKNLDEYYKFNRMLYGDNRFKNLIDTVNSSVILKEVTQVPPQIEQLLEELEMHK